MKYQIYNPKPIIIKEQQNLTPGRLMITDKSQHSLSPLSKNPLSIGKLIRSKRAQQQNPQLNISSSQIKNQGSIRQKSPRSIGINTSKSTLPTVPIIIRHSNLQNQLKPITHIKVKSPTVIVDESIELREHSNLMNGQAKNINDLRDSIPGIVDFPNNYYNDSQQPPQTPDLPNRLNAINSQSQTSIQSPILLMKKIPQKNKSQYSEPGVIKHQKNSRIFSNSAPKDFGVKTNESFLLSSPQLPYINKLQSSIQGFKKFINQPAQVSSSAQINSKNFFQTSNKFPTNSSSSSYNSPHIRKKSLPKNIGQIIKKNENSKIRGDPQQEQKLQQRKNFRISMNNMLTNRKKLPTFRGENKEEFEQQVDLDNSFQNHVNIKQKQQSSQSRQKHQHKSKSPTQFQHQPQPQTQPQCLSLSGSLISPNFLRASPSIRPQSSLSLDLRSSISKLKQSLIQSESSLSVSFCLPPILFTPPSSSSTSQQLHAAMLDIFSHVGLNPQIVSIKKYMNCVVMKDRKLCVLWNFNGKVYFGGWDKATIGEGNKSGIGLEFVPNRYVYYGEWRNNKKEGYGVMKKANKEIYIGCWRNNQRWGWGKLYDHQGNLHQNGQFIQGCFIYPQKNYLNSDANIQDKESHFCQKSVGN